MNAPSQSSRTGNPQVAVAAVVITVAVAIAALVVGRRDAPVREEPVSQQNQPDGPEQTVQRMLIAIQDGDVEAYLDCFADELRNSLQTEIAKTTSAKFAAELQRREADLRNFVTNNVRFPNENEALLELVRSYTDRNRRHRVRLKQIGGEWKITELAPLEQFQPEIPFGTPVVPGLGGQPEPPEK